MNDEPNVIDLFPTPLYVVTDVLTEEENQELIDHIIATQDKQVGKGKDCWDSGKASPKNSFGIDLKNEEEFNLILKKAHFHITQYAKNFNFPLNNFEYMNREWWWNVYGNHNYQEFHSHTPHLFSGVYYAKVPVGSSDIKFRHPLWNLGIPHTTENQYNSDHAVFKCYDRSMIIFPSTLLHCVPSGENTEPRISFSFNYG